MSSKKGCEAFACKSRFDVGDMMMDQCYLFDKSNKPKNSFLFFFKFCDQDYRTIFKHINTRWITLELAV